MATKTTANASTTTKITIMKANLKIKQQIVTAAKTSRRMNNKKQNKKHINNNKSNNKNNSNKNNSNN